MYEYTLKISQICNFNANPFDSSQFLITEYHFRYVNYAFSRKHVTPPTTLNSHLFYFELILTVCTHCLSLASCQRPSRIEYKMSTIIIHINHGNASTAVAALWFINKNSFNLSPYFSPCSFAPRPSLSLLLYRKADDNETSKAIGATSSEDGGDQHQTKREKNCTFKMIKYAQ